MVMNIKRSLSESGQSLVLVVLGFLAFIAVLALVVDGGNAYAAKRSAQNAADAGALAAAQYMCEHRHDADVTTQTVLVGQDYASRNGATEPAVVLIDFDNASVNVTATVTKPTFFAGAIGYENVAPRADATAQCRAPGAGVLPVAWSCRSTVVDGKVLPGDACAEKINPHPETDPYNLDYTYVVMDSVKVKGGGGPGCNDPNPPDSCYDNQDIECGIPAPNTCVFSPTLQIGGVMVNAGKIDCDVDNDCIDELMGGGARSWLDLDGSGGGAAQVKYWIEHPASVPDVEPHEWLASVNGTATSIFRSASVLVGTDVILPVFNNFCDSRPNIFSDQTDPESLAACTYTDLDNLDLAGANRNYHIISFSAFHVTCVQTGKNSNSVTAETNYFDTVNWTHGECAGHVRATQNCWTDPTQKKEICSLDDNAKTIEGYFTRLNVGGFSGPGEWFDTGTFTVVLVH
jgi:hypothetical protein